MTTPDLIERLKTIALQCECEGWFEDKRTIEATIEELEKKDKQVLNEEAVIQLYLERENLKDYVGSPDFDDTYDWIKDFAHTICSKFALPQVSREEVLKVLKLELQEEEYKGHYVTNDIEKLADAIIEAQKEV